MRGTNTDRKLRSSKAWEKRLKRAQTTADAVPGALRTFLALDPKLFKQIFSLQVD